MVANLHAEKDHHTLIAAWRSVVDRWQISRPPHLLLAGAFRERYQSLLAQVQSLGLERHVHFLGEVREVDDLYRAIDLCVFSSFREGIPNAILEAMAHERAVVATDYPGIREAVGAEGTPLLAAARDPQALADKILRAAGDDELRARFGRAGRERVREVFGVDVMAERMTRIVLAEWQRNPMRSPGSKGS
jgi:glycosyltransferase involved in cell wall biosynthesis